MMNFCGTLIALLFCMVIQSGLSASAQEITISDDACRKEGLSKPLRQTIVVLDQLAIDHWNSGEISETNRRWINALISLAGVQEGQRSANSAPRERFTVLAVRADGSDVLRVFTGCPPTYSQDELDSLIGDGQGIGGKFAEWLGKDPRSRIEAEQKAFRTKLLSAMVRMASEVPPKKDLQSSKFLLALPEIGRDFDVSNGVPRLVIFSPMNLPDSFPDQKSARDSGFRDAARTGADLRRAEIYIVRGKSQGTPFAREYAQALFLGAKGQLVDVSGETLPTLSEPPQYVVVYGGIIPYGQIKAPMQLRLAVDRTGTLVDSWVEVSVDKPVATPMGGKAICKSAGLDNCEIKGDGKDFAQLWVVDPDPNKPVFDPKLPFSGIRRFEFATTDKGVSGRFFDPMVIVNKQKELPFDLTKSVGVKF